MSDVPIFVSVINLIANPDRYHGRRVGVVGFCCAKLESVAVYVSESDYRAGVCKNGIWLVVDPKRAQALHEKSCLIWGIFDQEHQGHLSMFSGAIRDIERLQEWTI